MTNGKCRRFENKVILITGATGGIGRALSYRFADEGGTVILNFHQDSSRFIAEQMLGEIGTSTKSGTAQADITDPEQVKAMFVRIKETYSRLDVLINNAGINLNSLFVRTRPEDWKNLLDVNVMGTVYCCQQAILLMNRSGGGTIVNSSSMIGLSGNAGQAIYATTKAGIVGLTKSLAREYAAKNIRVNAVAAGFVDAGMTRAMPEEDIKRWLERVPLGRVAKPEEIAGIVSFLASEDASYLTGITICADGGWFMY